jgi:Glycosyl transferases group 1
MTLGEEMHRRFQFVVVGSAPTAVATRWRERVSSLGLTDDDVLFTGLVSDPDLDALHQAARVAFFPSLSEGFGMPVVEALAWGTPVVSSKTTSLPEIIGWDRGMFDPTDPYEVAAVLRSALVDDDFRRELCAAGDAARLRHTWPAVAQRISDALEAHVVPNLPTATPQPHRRSIAIVATDTAADSWAAKLRHSLSDACDVDVFGPDGTADIFPLEAFGRTSDPGRYDFRLFILANDARGAAAYNLARRYPGVVVLTDERLTRLGSSACGSDLSARLVDAYDTRLPAVVASDPEPTVELLERHDIRLLEPVVSPAHEVLAASVAIANAAALDIGPWRRPAPTTVTPTPEHVATHVTHLLSATR